jgi:tripartite motif-containing protein 71
MWSRVAPLYMLGTLFTVALLNFSPSVWGQGITPRSFVAANSESYVFDLEWGDLGDLSDEFNTPEGVAVDSKGNVWVADTNNHRILKFDQSGKFLFSFGSLGFLPGALDGQFRNPHGIAIDQQDNIWVADTFNNRVQKFNSQGRFLCKTIGLTEPHGIAVHPTNVNNVYVANTGANSIVRLKSNCSNNGGWGGGPSSADKEFNQPHDVAVDSSGRVYVADLNNHRIQVFNASGSTLVDKWGVFGTGDSRFTADRQFYNPAGVKVDACGNVFVSDNNNHRIQKFQSDGTFITSWGWFGRGDGQFDNPVGIALDGRGRVYIADRDNHRIQRFSPSTQDVTYLFKNKWGGQGSAEDQFNTPRGIAVNPTNGKVYVADTFNHRIMVFNANGVFDRQWGTFGTGDSQFSSPQGVAVDPTNGEVYVADTNNHRILVFNANSAPRRNWGGNGTANRQFALPQGVAVDPNSREVYVADTNNHRIQKFKPNGDFIFGIWNGKKWTGAGDPPAANTLNSWFSSPVGIAVDPNNGDVYVADTNNHRIQKFSGDGVFLTKWGTNGSGNGQFNSPRDLTVDNNGDVYVVDYHLRVQKFAPDGRFITKWGSLGDRDGLFYYYPEGVAVHSSDNFVYVLDTGNHRIQRFELFDFSLAVAPASRTVAKGSAAKYTLTLNGVGPNTLDTPVSFCLLSGLPNATTATFDPDSVTPSDNAPAPVEAELTLDTAPATRAKTYTVFIEATGGGQTRVRQTTLKVTN